MLLVIANTVFEFLRGCPREKRIRIRARFQYNPLGI